MNTKFKMRHIAALICGVLIASVASAGDVVVVMSASAAPLTKDEVAGVYLGRNASLKPVDLPEANTTRQVFYKKTTDRDSAQVKAVWARLTFTGGGQPPKELADDAAVKKAVAADPKAIGYISKGSVDDTVKVVLALD